VAAEPLKKAGTWYVQEFMNDERDARARAAAEIAAVLRELHVNSVPTQSGELRLVEGGLVDVRVATKPSIHQLSRWVAEVTSGPAVVVADRLGPAQRRLLEEAGWGWLDRSGHLRLRAGSLFLDRPVDSLLGPVPTPPDPLGKPSGLAVAAALLADLEELRTVRDVAAAAEVSVGSAHATISDLTEIGLLDRSRRPVVPDLFWEVAARWRVRWFPLAQPPRPGLEPGVGRLLQFGFESRDGPGWAEVGALAAQSYGVPVVASAEAPRIYLPSPRALTWAVRTWGEAHQSSEGAVRVAVPPTDFAVRGRRDVPHGANLDGWPLARPLVVAITMAADRDPRSLELLREWDPPPSLGQRRVW
jgi:hypothetical protein